MLTLCCPTWYSNPSVTYFYVYKSFKSLLGAMEATMEAAMELILIRKFCSFTIMCHCLDFGPGTNPVKISKILLGFWAGFLAPHRPPTPTKMTSMSCRTFLKLGVPPQGRPRGRKQPLKLQVLVSPKNEVDFGYSIYVKYYHIPFTPC